MCTLIHQLHNVSITRISASRVAVSADIWPGCVMDVFLAGCGFGWPAPGDRAAVAASRPLFTRRRPHTEDQSDTVGMVTDRPLTVTHSHSLALTLNALKLRRRARALSATVSHCDFTSFA